MAQRTRVNLLSAGKARLGQNFLTSPSAAEDIVAALGDASHSVVLEIGPGRGALTKALVKKAGQVIAIELDRKLAAELRLSYSDQQNLEVLEGDVLRMDFRAVLRPPGSFTDRQSVKQERAHLIGNLPYYITSDILLRLFEFHDQFDRMVIMVQREVADRIAAKPGSRDYGLLSATCQLYTKVEKLFTLPPGAFSPPPKVHSTVLRLRVAPRFEELGVPAKEFVDFLKLAFGMKRKTLVNNLKARYLPEEIRTALEIAGIRADVRAEAVSLEKSAEIFRRLQGKLILLD
ncbi:MAG TPA: 16S rRNA (adenine(1518)-N(6)/adenine(1519)-N(6))-dimethyltransferase RsmA [Candidatus Angelobacter sp.]|jgi:16S rRNA (adenine1518-N6/adenine1519-N6)-dimethyltransferase|nr:16S rRNA (adenine(1518)-N(6)/adenine(1519)-N(6))-dimethyltransferase RsmA [Candidatus Angelobacter sp.]